MQVQEIMHPGAEVIDPKTTIRDAAAEMRAENVGALPVDGNDIVVRAAADNRSPGATAVCDVLPALADLGRSGSEAAITALKGVSEPSHQPRR